MKKMIRIEILDGPEQAVDHSFREAKLCLGSSEENQVRMSGEGVTPFHAVIELVDDQGTLRVGPEGGKVQVNGTEVDGSILLQPGDEVQLGNQNFRYKLIPFPQPTKKRKIAMLEIVTLAALICGGAFQFYFLVGPAVALRSTVDVPLLRATPTPRPIPNAVVENPTPRPLPPSQIVMPTPIPSPEGVVDVSPAPVPGSQGLNAAQLTRRARRMVQEGDDLNAEKILQDALTKDPDYPPALIEMARLKERQSEYEQSILFWEKVQEVSPAGSMDAMDARLELQLLRRRKALSDNTGSEMPEVMPTPKNADGFSPSPAFPEIQAPIVQAKPQIQVEGIRMERFPESPRYDEFRMIHFKLEHQPGTPAVIAGEITVSVTFFEQEGTRVIQAKIPEAQIVLQPEEGLSGREKSLELSAAYDVPTGKGSPGRSYYGTVIQVYVEGSEVTKAADPAFLLDFIR